MFCVTHVVADTPRYRVERGHLQGYRPAVVVERIICLGCGLPSYNPNDITNRYCGWCHVFHDEAGLTSYLAAALSVIALLDPWRPL